MLVFYLILVLSPLPFYNCFDFLPDRYWLVAIPTHFFVTLVFIFALVKGWNYYITDENPVFEGIIY